jgi:hypothetical protein
MDVWGRLGWRQELKVVVVVADAVSSAVFTHLKILQKLPSFVLLFHPWPVKISCNILFTGSGLQPRP